MNQGREREETKIYEMAESDSDQEVEYITEHTMATTNKLF